MNLTNGLPTAAGNTSILFPGFNVTTTGGVAGLLTQEAAPGGTVTYTFTASSPGHARLLQRNAGRPAGRDGPVRRNHRAARRPFPPPAHPGLPQRTWLWKPTGVKRIWGEPDFRLAAAAYDHAKSLLRPGIPVPVLRDGSQHSHARQMRRSRPQAGCTAGAAGMQSRGSDRALPSRVLHDQRALDARRHGPQLRARVSAPALQRQSAHASGRAGPAAHHRPGPLAASVPRARQPRAHPGARREPDSQLRPNPTASLAGPLLFTTTTTPGQAMDGIFYYTGRGLNWDMYGHNPASNDPHATLPCTPDANGYNTGRRRRAINYYEWCQDHNKPLQAAPFGDVAGGGPATLPDPNILTNGAWYGGSPYLGPDATLGRLAAAPALQPARAAAPRRLHLRARSRTRPPARPASRSCGTRTTSARSPPTIFSRAE